MFSTLRCTINNKGKEGIIDCNHRPANEENGGIHHTACEYCRSKKLRCSGETPCKRCAAKGFDCQYPVMPKGRKRKAATTVQKPTGRGGSSASSTTSAAEPREVEAGSRAEEKQSVEGGASTNDEITLYNLAPLDHHTPEGTIEALTEGQNGTSQNFTEYDPMLDLYDLGTTTEFSDQLWPPLLSPSMDFICLDQDLPPLPSLNDDTAATKEGTLATTVSLEETMIIPEDMKKDNSKSCISILNDLEGFQGERTEIDRFSLLCPLSSASPTRPRTNHGLAALTSPLPKNLGQACQCLETSSKLMEVWEAHRHDSQNITIDCLLELQRQTAQLSYSVLACEYCSTRSSAMMLPLMLCEKLVCSSEHYNRPHLFAGVGKGKVGEYEICTSQEWAHIMRTLATLQWKATRELIQRYRMVAHSAGWQTQLAILANIEERFHSIVQSECIA
ncbi:hypothetical protein DM02DRAFT_706305 [Periconia macrospinosa]|uniref:Zn(2)-C6 fungal-type domain-containing protein n=1 Tax=Periconia macrospinosa TaxID=97972 RepID=A0A2V1CZL6_9PLEO|nr:hypothetical protein DM02DRAFT_706305 [Periconia macrospinosa]